MDWFSLKNSAGVLLSTTSALFLGGMLTLEPVAAARRGSKDEDEERSAKDGGWFVVCLFLWEGGMRVMSNNDLSRK